MSRVTSQLTISLDGFVAGPHQSLADPIGQGGERLHTWMFPTEGWATMQGEEGGEPGPDSDVLTESFSGIGAYIMGRKMFGGGDGEWDLGWRGWWGEDPPYHAPVFVLTHHARAPLVMDGGTTFTFVTDGPESALAQARAAAGDLDVSIAGGADTVQQYLRGGQIEELSLHIVPLILGSGERLLDGVGDLTLAPTAVVASPAVTHVTYRVG